MYQFKEKYTLDFTNIKYYLEIHSVIRQALDFPDYYGCNWDAFWDCLTDMVGRPIHIEIIGLDIIEKKFDDTAQTLFDILKELKHYNNDAYINDIKIEIVNDSGVTVL